MLTSLTMDELDVSQQHRQVGTLIEIDRFGERLIGCVVCNLWTWPTSPSVSMALPEDDLEALRKRVGRLFRLRVTGR